MSWTSGDCRPSLDAALVVQFLLPAPLYCCLLVVVVVDEVDEDAWFCRLTLGVVLKMGELDDIEPVLDSDLTC